MVGARSADCRDVRERRYKPLTNVIGGLYLRFLTSRRAAVGGPIERLPSCSSCPSWLEKSKLRASPCPRVSVLVRSLRNLR